ncbi:MAG: DUF1189 family protein [bacterium]|nr:DUF1189 family protein [bacterium]
MLRELWRSASDLGFYAEVALRPFGPAFRYLLKVTAVCGTVAALVVCLNVYFLNGLWRWCRDNLPVVTVRDGEASAEVAQPFLVERTIGDGEKGAIIIDTTGGTERVGAEYAAGALVARTGVVVKLGDAVLSWSYARKRDFVMDAAFFDGLIVRRRMLALFAAGTYAALLFGLLLQSAAGALLGEGIALLRGAAYSYRQVFQMSIYAAALSLFALFLLLIFGIWLRPLVAVAACASIHLSFLVAALFAAGREERAA